MFGTKLMQIPRWIYICARKQLKAFFVNFVNVRTKSGRMKVPLGLLKLGKHLENEIVARQFISVCVSLNKWRCFVSWRRNETHFGKKQD
jgi:hypothetical protein